MIKTHEEIRQTITFLGIEDCSLLWEATVEKGLYELPPEDRVRLARRAIEELLREGIVKLYRCHEPDGQLEEISKEKWEQVLSNQNSWLEPKRDTVSIRFGTTSEGKAAYFAAERSK